MNPIPYGRQCIEQDDIDAVVASLKSDFLTQGPKIAEFETAFARYTSADYAIAVSNATAGLHLSVLALGLQAGERVITTPITFAATANCVRYAGGEVWFADIDPETYLLSYEKTKALIESKPAGFFKGIIPVDFAGLPVNLEYFRQLADKHNLWIIEDACHAPGGHFTDYQGQRQPCGNGCFADLAVFSFHPVKHIACGEGGMITTNNESLYHQLKHLRTHGISKENMQCNEGGWYYEMQMLGYNYRLTDIQAALGLTQLAKNPQGVLRRNEIATHYQQAFATEVKTGKIKYQALPENTYNAHHLFVIEVKERKRLYDHLHQQQILAQVHYVPVHQLPYYKNGNAYFEGNLTQSENYYEHCLSLPMYPSLSDAEQDYVIKQVKAFYS